jgi:hypothetical protein
VYLRNRCKAPLLYQVSGRRNGRQSGSQDDS